MEVEETKTLRDIHNHFNRGLNLRFGDTSADFDKDAYRFHITVMLPRQPMEICHKYENDIQHKKVRGRYTARELAMFVYNEPMGLHGDYLPYKFPSFNGST